MEKKELGDSFTFSFEKLLVWQKARVLSTKLYALTKRFPQEERYGLTDQIRRAGVSVCSNIAEGSCRSSYKERERFIEIAYGSLMEICCQLQLATDMNFLDEIVFRQFRSDIREIALMLNALKANFSKRNSENI